MITQSVRILPRHYRLTAPPSPDSAAIVIRGDNLTVDMTGVVLEGTDVALDPDRAAGIGIRIEGGRNVRVVGAALRGYKIGVLAVETRNLVLRGIDAGYNWKPRLYSLVEHESLADWLSFHQNEKREWMRYGAAIYLEDVRGGRLSGNRVEQGMNGLLLVRSDSLRIEDNTFAFNSGLGIGLYRSSDNLIVRNRLDYNVRGYSHRFYRRGQDSAGLLLYEQSNRNVVAYNSATHGGDGLFLWAGQSTMDTGAGGANDNVFYANDFSYAPANGMEATFSRNHFLANRAVGSDYGLWGGYSWESTIAFNCFWANRIGIAIEHGQQNVIANNVFAGDTTAISLWANPIEPSDWGYPKHRDTKSRDYRISVNQFLMNRVGIRARNTAGLTRLTENTFLAVDSLATLDDSTGVAVPVRPPRMQSSHRSSPPPTGCEGFPPARWTAPLPAEFRPLVAALPNGPRTVPSSPLARLDRSAIVVDEWGPFDWRSPKLWPVDSTRAVPLRLRTGGPAGTWRLVEREGLTTVSKQQGRIGDTITVFPTDSATAWSLMLEYRGGATRSPRGMSRPAGSPYRFGYEWFEPDLEWNARFYAWPDSTSVLTDPRGFAVLAGATPILERRLSRLDLQWYRPHLRELPQARWALEATGSVTLPAGAYRLRTISDDGIRVWVNGDLVIDRWTQHESTLDEVPLAAGRHELRVQFFQLDGWTELRVEILRAGAGR